MAFCSNILFAELFFTNLAVLSTANIYRHLPSLSETSERKLKDSALETIRSRYRIGDRSTTWSLHYRDTLVWPTWSIRADRTDVNNSVRRNVLKGKTKKKHLRYDYSITYHYSLCDRLFIYKFYNAFWSWSWEVRTRRQSCHFLAVDLMSIIETYRSELSPFLDNTKRKICSRSNN